MGLCWLHGSLSDCIIRLEIKLIQHQIRPGFLHEKAVCCLCCASGSFPVFTRFFIFLLTVTYHCAKIPISHLHLTADSLYDKFPEQTNELLYHKNNFRQLSSTGEMWNIVIVLLVTLLDACQMSIS